MLYRWKRPETALFASVACPKRSKEKGVNSRPAPKEGTVRFIRELKENREKGKPFPRSLRRAAPRGEKGEFL